MLIGIDLFDFLVRLTLNLGLLLFDICNVQFVFDLKHLLHIVSLKLKHLLIFIIVESE